jgi:hypothetical protein
MTKKTYLRPSTNVEEGAIEQMVCASLSSVTSSGLDTNESLDYGDTEGNREKNLWDEAW